jgi:hypothetical protein
VRGGRGGNFIYFTHDNRLVIKHLTKTERKILVKEFLPKYYEHRLNNESLLVKIYGVFTIKTGRADSAEIMVMENLVKDPERLIGVFDLKGSCKDR